MAPFMAAGAFVQLRESFEGGVITAHQLAV